MGSIGKMRDLDQKAHQEAELALLKVKNDGHSMGKANSSAKHDGRLWTNERDRTDRR